MKIMTTRIKLLESRIGISKEPPPTIFLKVVDSSMPDPAVPEVHIEYSDATITAASTGGGAPTSVKRLPGESVEALQDRATRLLPHCRVFMAVYAEGEVAA